MDLEKLAQEVIKGASIQNLNFNDIHDNQNVYMGCDGIVSRQQTDNNLNPVIQQLRVLFKNNIEEATSFYNTIQGLKPYEITRYVNRLQTAKKIEKDDCYKPLYDILHENDLYKRTLSTWDSQIK